MLRLSAAAGQHEPFASTSAGNSKRPPIQRRTSLQLPSPDSSPNGSTMDLDDPFAATPTKSIAAAKTPTNLPGAKPRHLKSQALVQSRSTTPVGQGLASSSSRGAALVDEDEDDPFIDRPGAQRVHQGQNYAKPADGGMMTYVFRGKRIKFDRPLMPSSNSTESPFGNPTPKLLFPSRPVPANTEQEVESEPRDEMMADILSTPMKTLPSKPAPPQFGIIPPTPMSNPRKRSAPRPVHTMDQMIEGGSDEADEPAGLTRKPSVDDVFGGETRAAKMQRVRKNMDLARRAGGGRQLFQ